MKSLIENKQILYLNHDEVEAFGVYDFAAVRSVLKDVYRAKKAGETAMPKSDYLKYPGRPSYDRIITLLGYLGGPFGVSGVKEICSSTGNAAKNLPRASGLIILNDPDTQRPFAIMEASLISASRTAGVTSIAIELAAKQKISKLAFIGCGALARCHAKMWNALYLDRGRALNLYDRDRKKALEFAEFLRRETRLEPSIADSAREAICGADLIIPMTTEETPYIKSEWIRPDSLYSAVSLLDPELATISDSELIIVDDLGLCLHEGRPLQRLDAEKKLDRSKVCEIASIIENGVPPNARRIFCNPMGTVVTDLAVAHMIFEAARSSGAGTLLEL